jgi:hypothetical protein
MLSNENSQAVPAFALLGLYLLFFIPADTPGGALLSSGLLLLLPVTVTIGVYSIAPQRHLLLPVALVTSLTLLTGGLTLQFIPRAANTWLFLVLIGLATLAVLNALIALLRRQQAAFLQTALTLETAAYVLWLTLTATLRIAGLALPFVFLILLLTGTSFATLLLELRTNRPSWAAGWLIGFLLAQAGALLLVTPVSGILYALLLGSLFHLLLLFATSWSEKRHGLPWFDAIWLPALLLLACLFFAR